MKIAIFGTSGFSREVADICIDLGYKEIIFIGNNTNEDSYFGFLVIDEANISCLTDQQYDFAIGIGDNELRSKIYYKFPQLNYVNLIHPSATFGYRQLNQINNTKGNIITAGVRITNNVKIGDFGIYNLNTTIGHDCIIGDFVTFSPGANVSGNVKILDKAYIGTNATILQGKSINDKLTIGENSIVGAGSVVNRDVPPNCIVKGVPAK